MATGGDKTPITVYLSKEDRDRLQKLANLNERVISSEARKAIKEYVNRKNLWTPDNG